MKKYILAFLLLLLVFCRQVVARTPVEESDQRLDQTVAMLNRQIELNQYYLSIGRADLTKYVVDMRKIVLGDQNAFLNTATSQAVNDQLLKHKTETEIGTYLLVSMPYTPKAKQTKEQMKQYQEVFTKAILAKSKLSDEANKGVLINIDGYVVTQRVNQNGSKVNVLSYTIALGKRLSTEAIIIGLEALKKDAHLYKLSPDYRSVWVPKFVAAVCATVSGIAREKYNEFLSEEGVHLYTVANQPTNKYAALKSSLDVTV